MAKPLALVTVWAMLSLFSLRWIMALAKASASSDEIKIPRVATEKPPSPFMTVNPNKSSIPPTRVEITGFPAAIASINAT